MSVPESPAHSINPGEQNWWISKNSTQFSPILLSVDAQELKFYTKELEMSVHQLSQVFEYFGLKSIKKVCKIFFLGRTICCRNTRHDSSIPYHSPYEDN